jgi:formylglycine-generating enzyme required for sulfatase activity
MKSKLFPLIISLILTLLFTSCGILNEDGENSGNLALILEFPQPGESLDYGPGKNLAREAESIDEVFCYIYRNGNPVWDASLPEIGGYFQASVELQAGSGYEAHVECYDNGEMKYYGDKAGITIVKGQTTTEVVPLLEVIGEPPSNPDPGDEWTVHLGTAQVPLTMVYIGSGSFMQGRYPDPGEQDSSPDESPRHLVTFSYGFWVGKYEVTQAQWEAVLDTNWDFNFDNHPNYPAEEVSWDDIHNLLLPILNNYSSGEPWRLPSESEWEYACRAGAITRFYWGNDPSYSQIENYAWYQNAIWNTAHSVGTNQPNAFGLYDMSGNVEELCEDYWHSNYNGAPDDGSAWLSPTSSYCLNRGGSWLNSGEFCRSADRHHSYPFSRSNNVGFRLVRNP